MMIASSHHVLCDLQLNSENRKLKYLSLSSRTSLDEMLPSVTLEEVSDTSDTSPDSFTHYQQQVKGEDWNT